MRPRQSSLGIRHVLVGFLFLLAASMRPRQSSLGIATPACAMQASSRSFNEAEAIKPRNRLIIGRKLWRFQASMRPRQSSLGIVAGGVGAACTGDRFNEAEAIKPRNLPFRQLVWSMGTGFNEAEAIKPRNRYNTRQFRVDTTASMRPRQSSLGILFAGSNPLAIKALQ